MAEEALVKEALTDGMIAAGSTVLEMLDHRNFAVDAAMWVYLSDVNQWRLLLATPGVRIDGPRKAYKRLVQILRNVSVHGLSVQNIAVVDSHDPFIQLVRSAIGVSSTSNGVRFARNMVNGQFIEDAYIYRTAA